MLICEADALVTTVDASTFCFDVGRAMRHVETIK